MARDASYPLDVGSALGGNSAPRRDGGARHTQAAGDLCEQSSLSSDYVHPESLHATRLSQISGARNRICLGHASVVGGILEHMEMGNRIAVARKRAGMTQRALAQKVGVTPGLVGAWETHRSKPGRDNLERLAQVLTVSVAYLLGQEEIDQITTIPTEGSDEVALLRRYRTMTPTAKKNVRQLFDAVARIGQEIEHEGRPPQAGRAKSRADKQTAYPK